MSSHHQDLDTQPGLVDRPRLATRSFRRHRGQLSRSASRRNSANTDRELESHRLSLLSFNSVELEWRESFQHIAEDPRPASTLEPVSSQPNVHPAGLEDVPIDQSLRPHIEEPEELKESETAFTIGDCSASLEAQNGNPPPTLPPEGANSPEKGPEHLSGIRLFTLVAALTLAAFLLMIDSTILVTAIPSITTSFNSVTDVGWYGSSYLLATCTLQLFFGKLYDVYNSKLTFVIAFVIFEVGSLVCALASSSIMFIAGRVVSGLGGAGILNGAFTIIASAVPLHVRPKLLGIILGVASIGVAAGPIIGGALTERTSWRWCFWLNLPVGAVTVVVLVLIRIPNAQLDQHLGRKSFVQHIRRLDIPGTVLFGASVVLLLLALNWAGVTYAWDSLVIVNLFWGAGAAFVSFIIWEHWQGSQAMLDLELFRNRIVTFSAAASFMSYGGLYAIVVFLPIWFQAVEGVSPLTSGVDYLPSVVTTTLATILSGILVSRLGYYTPFMLVGGAIAALAAGLLTTLSAQSSTAVWVVYQLINGLARGMLSQQPITAIQANLPKEKISMGTAVVIFSQNLGASVFVTLSQTTFQNTLLEALRHFAPEVDPNVVVEAGATDFRDNVPTSSIPHVVTAYNQAITRTFYLAMGASIAVFLLAWGMGWTSVKTVKPSDANDANDAG